MRNFALMSITTIEMLTEPGAEGLITAMGKRLKTKARSKVMDKTLTHIREQAHNSDVTAWFSEERFAAARRTTIRISRENADYLATISQIVGRGRPAVLLDMVYYAAANLSPEDFDALR